MSKYQIAVLGAGNMGTAIAYLLAKNGNKVRLWDYNPETLKVIARKHENVKYLPGVKLLRNIYPEIDLQKAVAGAKLIVVACASPYMRATVKKLNLALVQSATPEAIVHIAKGLEDKTFLTMHEVVQSELLPKLQSKVVTLSGPSIAMEFVKGIPTAVVCASDDKQAWEVTHKAFESPLFRVVLSRDVRGVGLCGALKNVFAIALGMCDGVSFSMNSKASMLTAALAEMKQIVCALGGQAETVCGLAGLGDMVVTGLGQGRNRALGEEICKIGHCKFVHNNEAQTHEGVVATKIFYNAVQKKKLQTPLLNMVYKVLYLKANPCVSVKKFFSQYNGL